MQGPVEKASIAHSDRFGPRRIGQDLLGLEQRVIECQHASEIYLIVCSVHLLRKSFKILGK